MDPYRFSYSPVVERPKLSWPNGARVAVWVCPNIEHYEYVPTEVRVRNPWPRMPHPDVLGYGGAIAVVAALTAASGLWVALDMPSSATTRIPGDAALPWHHPTSTPSAADTPP